MSPTDSDAQIYAKQLLPKRHGYPLWVPEPVGHSPTYRTKGVRVGDVGYVNDSGAFETLFNIRASPNDPINQLGVPDGFEQMVLDSSAILSIPNFHRPHGGPVISASGKKQGVDAGVSIETPLIPASGLSVGTKYSWSTSEGAILHLPEGAARISVPPERFRRTAQKGAESWYRFANTTMQLGIPNGALCLVTGCDKTRAWMVGCFSNSSSECQASVAINSAYSGGVRVGFVYSWDSYSSVVDRIGPLPPHHADAPIIPPSDEDLALDSLFDSDAPSGQTQTVFIRGYRIMLRPSLWSSLFRSPVKITMLDDTNLTRAFQNDSLVPYSESQEDSSGHGLLWGFGSSRKRAADLESQQDSDSEGVEDVGLQLMLPFEETADPAHFFNQWILQMAPTADVAIVHDDEWGALLPDTKHDVINHIGIEYLNSKLLELGAKIVIDESCAFLQNATDRDTNNMVTASDSSKEPKASLESVNDSSPPNIIVFGDRSGRRALIRCIENSEGVVSWGATGNTTVTFSSRRCGKVMQGQHFNVFDTVGLNAGAFGTAPPDAAIKALYKSMHSLEQGINLLVFVVQDAFSIAAQTDYKLFCEIFCQFGVKVVLVITTLFGEADRDKWLQQNRSKLEKSGMSFSDMACINVRGGAEERSNRSKDIIAKLICEQYQPVPWCIPVTDWFTTVTTAYCQLLVVDVGLDPIQVKATLRNGLLRYTDLTGEEVKKRVEEVNLEAKNRGSARFGALPDAQLGRYSDKTPLVGIGRSISYGRKDLAPAHPLVREEGNVTRGRDVKRNMHDKEPSFTAWDIATQ